MSPLERACRALWRLGDNGGWDTDDIEQENANWKMHLRTVHTVLDAIREPSSRMTGAGKAALAETGNEA